MFLKNGFFCILYPDSKIMGGSSNIMKRLLKWFEMFAIIVPIASSLSKNPHSIPINVVRPASCKYLCFDFLRKWPDDMAIISKKMRHRISVEITDFMQRKRIKVRE